MGHTSIQQLAQKFTAHPTIQAYTDLPSFPVLRTEWLRTQLSPHVGGEEVCDRLLLAAALLQHGLDTHDEVPAQNQAEHLPTFRALQLKVLAGDYFSSRYYELLAEVGDVQLVRALAQAVCQVNLMKIELYQLVEESRLTADEYLERLTKIRLPVYQCFKSLIPESLATSWDEMLYVLTYCEVVWGELQAFARPKRLLYWYILEHGSLEDQQRLRSPSLDIDWLTKLADKYNPTDWVLRKLATHAQFLEKQLLWLRDETLRRDLLPFNLPLKRLLSVVNAVN